ncbi:MAG: phage holin family protein [Bacteroidetes bacterium]|nr:phage holin family protein [Bacteroidota bacterium]
MEEQATDIDNLLSDAGDYIETRTALWKLKAIESLSDVSGELVSGLGMIVISSFVVIIFSIGLALLVGDWVGKSYYGFFIVGGVYAVIALVLYVRRGHWLKEPFSNMLIRKILK